MEHELLTLFKEYGDKQEILSKLCESEELQQYNNSELHIIDAIGKLESPNVTAIAEYLNMTKGGISKNIKKLIHAEIVTSYQINGNSRKVFYALTDKGIDIFEKHEIAHKSWSERDSSFFSGFDEEEISIVSMFLKNILLILTVR